MTRHITCEERSSREMIIFETKIEIEISESETLRWFQGHTIIIFQKPKLRPPGYPCTVGRMTTKSTRRVLGHLRLCLLVCSHCSLIRFPRTARFARALRFAHLFVRSLTHSRACRKVKTTWFCPTVIWPERNEWREQGTRAEEGARWWDEEEKLIT